MMFMYGMEHISTHGDGLHSSVFKIIWNNLWTRAWSYDRWGDVDETCRAHVWGWKRATNVPVGLSSCVGVEKENKCQLLSCFPYLHNFIYTTSYPMPNCRPVGG
jgi:hypothetical protein